MKREFKIISMNGSTIIADEERMTALGSAGFSFAGIIPAFVDAEGFTNWPQVIMERTAGSAPIRTPSPPRGGAGGGNANG